MPRHAQFPIDPLFLNRWSPRAMSGETISDTELFTLFEAARWAPSSYNGQPWRFIFARRDTSSFKSFFSLLDEGNQAWCKNAAVLVLIASRKLFEYNGSPSITHSFDTGSAWENLALQGSFKGLVVHGMQGFDYEKMAQLVQLPPEFVPEAMCAIGKPGPMSVLPPDVQKNEHQSDRKPLAELVFEGKFGNKVL